MEKINYFELFVKAIVFAFIILVLKTFFAGVSRAEDIPEIPSSSVQVEALSKPKYTEQRILRTEKQVRNLLNSRMVFTTDNDRILNFYEQKAAERFRKRVNDGYSIHDAKYMAINEIYSEYKADPILTDEYRRRLKNYRQNHKFKYYTTKVLIWPFSIPITAMPELPEDN